MIRLALVALLAFGCAEQHPANCPVAERGAWVVVSSTANLTGPDLTGPRPGLLTADICDEQTSDEANRLACEDRARAFNAELAEGGNPPVYFVMWSEE